MKRDKIPEAFHPGEYLKEELEIRQWSAAKFARLMGKPVSTVDQIIAGKSAITWELAQCFGKVFGKSAQMWLNLQTAYDAQEELKSARKKR